MRSSQLAMILACFMASQSAGPIFAAPSTSDIVHAINKNQFLPIGTPVNVKLDKGHVFVSTYRHGNADENDCKIDAVLIGKAIVEIAPAEITRVTSYFYGKDMSNYQEVSVTAGDITSFATGQMTQQQLLSSLVVRTVTNQNEADRVARQLESNWVSRPTDYKVCQDTDTLSVTTGLDAWVSDEDCRLEALRIAINTLQVQPSAQQVKVTFVDPSFNADSREFVFKAAGLAELWKTIQGPLAAVAMVRRPAAVDLQSLTATKGTQQEAREALLSQLKEMEVKGIGVAPFVKAFLGVEQAVKRGAESKTVADMVTRLRGSVEDQLKAYVAAKEAKPKPAALPPPSTGPAPKVVTKSRWVIGDKPIIEGEVLADPNRLVNRFESTMAAGFASVDDNPKYLLLLDQVVAILQKNNRGAEADKFQHRAAAIRAKKPN